MKRPQPIKRLDDKSFWNRCKAVFHPRQLSVLAGAVSLGMVAGFIVYSQTLQTSLTQGAPSRPRPLTPVQADTAPLIKKKVVTPASQSPNTPDTTPLSTAAPDTLQPINNAVPSPQDASQKLEHTIQQTLDQAINITDRLLPL